MLFLFAAINKYPKIFSYFKFPDEVRRQIFKHFNLIDLIEWQISELTVNDPILIEMYTEKYSRIKLAPLDMLAYCTSNELRDADTVLSTILKILKYLGPHITDLTIEYNVGLRNVKATAELVSATVAHNCKSLIRYHVIDVSVYHAAGINISYPDLSNLEAFVYTDDESTSNKDDVISMYLNRCSNNLESLNIHRTCLIGTCAINFPPKLQYLKLKSNFHLRKVDHGNSEIIGFYISDISNYCRSSPVQHLELYQENLLINDIKAIISFRNLTYLSVAIDNSTSANVNLLFVALAQANTVENLQILGMSRNRFNIQEETINALDIYTKLSELYIKGATRHEVWEERLKLLKSIGLLKRFRLQ